MLSINVNNIFSESRYVKDYKNVKLANMPSFWATQLPLIITMIYYNKKFWVWGNVKFSAEANFEVTTTKICILHYTFVL